MAFSVFKLFDNHKVTNPKGMKRENLPYVFTWVIYYAWVVAFTTWWTASPLAVNVFDSDIRIVIHTVYLLSSAVFIIVSKKEWYVKSARVGAVLTFAGVIIYLVTPSALIQIIAAVIIGVSLGCVNISILMHFVFTLNNSEKLYSVVGTNLLVCLITLLQNTNLLQNSRVLILAFVILVAALVAIVFFHKNGVNANADDDTPETLRSVYLSIFFNCVFTIIGKGIGTAILNITAEKVGSSVILWYYIGGILGCFMFLLFFAFASKPIIILGNTIFAIIAMGLLCNAFIPQAPAMAIPFAVLLGAGSTAGTINIYYVVGIIGKKFNSMRYIKWSVLLIGAFGGVAGIVLGNIIHSVNAFGLTLTASLVTVTVLLTFMILSPILAQRQYYDDWARDSEISDIDNDKLYIFQKYKLSKREIDVCKLLLQGYTLRQISAMLSIAYSTVNTYCTAAYRKLSINSRAELMILFKEYITE